MKRYVTFLIRYRVLVLIGIIVLTVIFGAIASRGVIASSVTNMFFGKDHPGFQQYKQRIREFANDEVFIVIYHDPDLLSEASLSRLETVVDTIQQLDDVGRVDSLLTAQHTFAEGDTLYVNHYTDEALEEPERRAEILNTLKTDPLLQGLFVSEDGEHAAVIIEMTPNEERPAEKGPELVNRVIAIFQASGFPRQDMHLVGMMTSLAATMEQASFSLFRLFPIVCIVLLGVVYLIFHRLWPVLITLLVCFVGVIWMLGFAVLLDRNINVFVAGLPAIILIVATSDVIHLCNAYILELAHGRHKMHAILQSFMDVGTACFWTSATTFVGFVSMAFVPVPMMQQTGVVLGFGVAISLLLALTLSPILFALLRPPKSSTYDVTGAQKLLGSLLFHVEGAVLRYPKSVVVGFLILFVCSSYGVYFLHIETDFSKRLDEDHWARQDETYYNDHFAGANFLEVFIDTPQAQGVLERDRFAQIAAFQQAVEALPEVDNVTSLVNLITTIDREMNPPSDAARSEPLSSELLAQYLLLFEMSGGEDLDRLINFDRATLRLAVRLAENGMVFSYESGRAIQRLAETMFGEGVTVQITGLNYLLGGFLDDVFLGQQRGLAFAILTIFIMMAVMFRSFKIGAWSMVPNILPLLALGGYVGYFWPQVDSDTIIIAMIAIGIGVDDTIHFLMRLSFETRRTSDIEAALQKSFHFSGRAMISTTIILAVGFAPFATSSYFSTRILGTLLPFTLIVALLADILLVPAMVKLGAIRFRQA